MSRISAVMPAREAQASAAHWATHRGYASVTACIPELEHLADRSGQHGAMSHLDLVLRSPYSESRRAHPLFQIGSLTERLARTSKQPTVLINASSSGTSAAALLFEYRIFGLPTTIFVPVDLDGWRTVVTEPGMRLQAAYEAAATLLSGRATVVLISFCHDEADLDLNILDSRPDLAASMRLVASRSHEVRRILPLLDTYDETLATLGNHTRRNLRAARRKLTQDLGICYESKATPTLEQCLELNRQSRYPVQDWVTEWRYHAVRSSPYGFLSGLRDPQGEWLSVIGGRRHKHDLFIDWQLNRDDLGSLSLGTAIRAWMLDDEVERGTQSVRYEGGTNHPMRSAFKQEYTHDLLFTRRFVSRKLLSSMQPYLPKGGQLEEFLNAPETAWYTGPLV